MKSSHKRMAALVLIGTMAVMTLSGCKDENADPLMSESKETLVEMINDTNSALVASTQRVTELETLLTAVQEEKGPTSAIVELSDGTGRKTFTTVDGKFTLPIEFKYPGSTQAPNTSSINISEAVSIVPTTNWTAQLNGTKLDLYHSSGISGVVTVGYLDREAQKLQPSELQASVDEMLSALPIDSKKTSSLFVNGTKFGIDNVSHTFIDEDDAIIRCGVLGFGELSLQYFFVYTGEQDAAKDEVILSLIKTIHIWNSALSIE